MSPKPSLKFSQDVLSWVKARTLKQFLKIHFETLYACDFFSVEVLGVLGTARCTPMPSSGF
jgi:hypothetical protein